MEMNSRERALAALNRHEVFPIPTDVMENLIYPDLERDLCRHFGFAPEDHEGLLQALNAHARWGKPAYIGPALEEAPVQPPSSFPQKKAARNIWGGWSGLNSFTSEIERPMAALDSVEEVDGYPWPDPGWYDYARIGWLENSSSEYPDIKVWANRHEDKLRIVGGFLPIFCRIMDLTGMEEGLMITATRPDLTEALVSHITDFLEEHYRRLAVAGAGLIDVMAFGDDFASQQGLMLQPALWRRYFMPAWKRLFAVAHRHGMKAMFHSCGSVRPVLGDLIDAGMDIFEVVQTTAKDMEAEPLKRDFGRDVAFYGAVDTQHLLPRGTPDEVRGEVRRLADVLGEGGGYVLGNAHILMEDVPKENVLALFDEARTYRAG